MNSNTHTGPFIPFFVIKTPGRWIMHYIHPNTELCSLFSNSFGQSLLYLPSANWNKNWPSKPMLDNKKTSEKIAFDGFDWLNVVLCYQRVLYRLKMLRACLSCAAKWSPKYIFCCINFIHNKIPAGWTIFLPFEQQNFVLMSMAGRSTNVYFSKQSRCILYLSME